MPEDFWEYGRFAKLKRWTEEGIEYETDGEHRAKLMKVEGLEEGSKVALGPAVTDGGGVDVLEEVKLEGAREHNEFRSKGATMNYLGEDRSVIQYAVKMICQKKSAPTEGGKTRIERAGMYLVGANRLVWRYAERELEDEAVVVDVFVDSDWASGAEKKSTSGGAM